MVRNDIAAKTSGNKAYNLYMFHFSRRFCINKDDDDDGEVVIPVLMVWFYYDDAFSSL